MIRWLPPVISEGCDRVIETALVARQGKILTYDDAQTRKIEVWRNFFPHSSQPISDCKWGNGQRIRCRTGRPDRKVVSCRMSLSIVPSSWKSDPAIMEPHVVWPSSMMIKRYRIFWKPCALTEEMLSRCRERRDWQAIRDNSISIIRF